MKEVVIFTDGGCEPNPGCGGYAAVLTYGEHTREISGGFRLTTNNRMEMLAAIMALECLKEPCRVSLHSDSQYLVRAMEMGTASRSHARGFRRRNGKRIPNADLWERLITATARHEVKFVWVRGHNGDPLNERCDLLAARALRGTTLAVDAGYESALAVAKSAWLLPPDEAPAEPAPDATAATGIPGSPRSITDEGRACRKCGTAVVRRTPRKRLKPDQAYYFEYYLYCPKCRTMYMVEAAKRWKASEGI